MGQKGHLRPNLRSTGSSCRTGKHGVHTSNDAENFCSRSKILHEPVANEGRLDGYGNRRVIARCRHRRVQVALGRVMATTR